MLYSLGSLVDVVLNRAPLLDNRDIFRNREFKKPRRHVKRHLKINICAMMNDYLVIIAFCSHFILLTNDAANGLVGEPYN